MTNSIVKLVNLTPHALNLAVNESCAKIIPASGKVARVSVSQEVCGSINGYEVRHNVYGDVIDLPEPEAGTIYIVSGLVLSALAGSRDDVVGPDTGASAIREDGRIVAVTGFVR